MSIEAALAEVLGAPYADPPCPPDTFNCTALVRWLRAQVGLDTPLCLPSGASWLSLSDYSQQRRIAETKKKHPWARVAEPMEADLVLCGHNYSAPAYHVGLWLPHGVAHAYSSLLTGQGSVVLTSHPLFLTQYPHMEFWRLGE